MVYLKLILSFLAGAVEAIPIISRLWAEYAGRRREKVAMDRLNEKVERNGEAVRNAFPPVSDGMHDGKDGQCKTTDCAG